MKRDLNTQILSLLGFTFFVVGVITLFLGKTHTALVFAVFYVGLTVDEWRSSWERKKND